MAFHETDGRCADCGADAFAATDVFASRDETPLCFPCYVDRLDRVRASGVVNVADGEFVVGASSVEKAREIAHAVSDELPPSVDGSVRSVTPLVEARSRGHLTDYHARELARGARSETRHVYAGTSKRGTVVDVETSTGEDTRVEVRDSLARRVLDENRVEVRKRADVSGAIADTLPTLVEHRAARTLGVEHAVWGRAKERGVSRGSERAERNQKAGRDFEEYFVDWCEDRNLEVTRGKTALVRRYPDVADDIARKTDGLAGVPDFVVRGDGQRVFGDGDVWRPDDEAFVEVKRGGSSLTREQQDVVAHLKSHGFDVFVLRGEPNSHRFERR